MPLPLRHSIAPLATQLALSLTAALAACGAPPGEASRSTTQDLVVFDDCDDWGCGKNSPVVGGLAFHEIHPGGLPNSAGLTVGAFRAADGTLLTLLADGHRLQGLTPTGRRLEGDHL